MTAFNIGDKVRWQCRNMYRCNKWMPSFYMFSGIIEYFTPDAKNPNVLLPVAKYTYCGRNEQGRDVAKEAFQTFRLLKNGKYIAQEESRDDPKGRLYLCLNQEAAE
jgi:hypothetical protein